MGTTTMGVKLDDATRERIKSAATRIDRTPHWLIKQAIFSYLEQLENSMVSQNAQADVSFSADASDLLMIAARKQDPDTLFFQRRLVIEGDTELGLYVKNLMDAIELEQMPKALRMMLLQLADFVEAGMKTAPETKQTSVGEPC